MRSEQQKVLGYLGPRTGNAAVRMTGAQLCKAKHFGNGVHEHDAASASVSLIAGCFHSFRSGLHVRPNYPSPSPDLPSRPVNGIYESIRRGGATAPVIDN